MKLRARLSAPAFLTVLAFSRAAFAEPTELERARTLFDEAGELERRQQWTAAHDKLRAALQLRETPHLRYALGWALENSGRLIEARTEYEVALQRAQRAGVDEVSRLAASRIGAIDQKIPHLRIHVRGSLAPTTHVLVDGREVLLDGDVGTVPVDPGARTVRVDRGGESPSEQDVTVAQGSLRVVEINGDFRAAGDAVHPDTRRGPVLPWVFVGGGGALALGGILLFVSSSSDGSTRDDNMRRWCDATACVGGTTATRPETTEAAAYRREAYDASSRGNAKQVVGAVMGGVGVAGIVAGTYMLLSKHERDGAPRASHGAIRVDGAPLPGGGMAGASFTF